MQPRCSQQSGLTGSRVHLKQALYLLLLLLKFKARRIPVTLVALVLLPLNFWIFTVFSTTESTNSAPPEAKKLINAQTFPSAWQALIDSSVYISTASSLQTFMTNRGSANDASWLLPCDGLDNCRVKYLRQLLEKSRTNLFGHVIYRNISDLQLECMKLQDTDLVCSYLYHLIVQALSTLSTDSVFKDVQFVQYMDLSKSAEISLVTERMNVKLSDNFCTQSVKAGVFIVSLWWTVLIHTFLTTTGCMMHFTGTTVAFISGLKENGFLQLMFSSGLSVAVYWSVILCVTVLESTIFASILALCYGFQCPELIPTEAAVKLLFVYLAYCYTQASLALLATVIFKTYFLAVIATAAETLVTVAVSAVGLLRLSTSFLENVDDEVLLSLLIYPPGHIVQYSIYILQPDKMLHSTWSEACQRYMHYALILMLALPFAVTLLTIYLDFILANGNGFQLPPWFVFSPDFWFPGVTEVIAMESLESDQGPNTEQVVNGQPAICIRDISVRYSDQCGCCSSRTTLALNSVSSTIYRGQITALIGHNGAGKTTLIRVLTGEETPSSGMALIAGRTVTDPYQRLTLRRKVSVCKQVDVLSPHLTVAESIRLAVLSKGLSMWSLRETIDHMMQQLGLSGKEDVRAVDLSGGQLRKVCCIIALLGDPAVVLLDEPTSGLDPVSRRRLWQILQDFKQDRCIILCTQFMDEADILADRKLFLSSGRLICAGSSLYLKHMFGCSTQINVSLKSETDAPRLMAVMHKGVQLVSQAKTELLLRVPSSASELQVLAKAVCLLEENGALVDTFGVSQANLDDIFMRLENADTENLELAMESGQMSSLFSDPGDVPTLRHPSLLVGSLEQRTDDQQQQQLRAPACQAFASLMAMNLRRQLRSPVHFTCRFLMPIALIALVGVMFHVEKEQHNTRKLAAKALVQHGTVSRSTIWRMTFELERSLEAEMVRIPILPNMVLSTVICVSDEESVYRMDASDCNRLVYDGVLSNASYEMALTKPKSESLDDFFLSNKSTIALLHQLCKPQCLFAYASSWSSRDPNRERTVVIGQYGKEKPVLNADLPSYDVFNIMLRHFGLAELQTRVRLSQIVTFEFFTSQRNELLVLLIFYSIIPATFLTDPVEDRTSRVRQQMYVMGLSSKAYWANTFVIHWTQYVLLIFLAMLVTLQWDRYRSTLLFCSVGVPLLLVGTVGNLLTVYCIGSMQRTANYSVMAGYFFFAMMLCFMPLLVARNRVASAIAIWMVPPFAPLMLAFSAMKLFSYGLLYFERDRIGDVPEMWTALIGFSDTWHVLAAMPVHILLQLVFLLVSENWARPPAPLLHLQRLLGLRPSPTDPEPEPTEAACAVAAPEEAGVSQERDRVELHPRSDSNLLEVRRLVKVHPNGVMAVRGVTLGAGPGEIFGLLGQNGAGKTTLMSVIVGEVSATDGQVEVWHGDDWIGGVDGARHGAIGYCPQHNPLFEGITVEEHLHFYAQIRGLPDESTEEEVDSLIDCLGLSPHRRKAARHLSGGNKRRLCLAVALLGSPSVVVIDEASTGVDPGNKRAIWGAIRGMIGDGSRAVVVTTHSMEEVEALCSRVGIMDKGVMIGFGTVQQLRSRHGKAYILDALFPTTHSNSDVLTQRKQALKQAILRNFPNSLVIEDVCASVQFQIPTESIPKLSAGICWLAENQSRLGVEYCSLHQMSLDQVFVNMMKQHAQVTEDSDTPE